MSDALPAGKWTISRSEGDRPPPRFTLEATDAGTGDSVVAIVNLGDLGGYEQDEDLGIPAAVERGLIWCLIRIEPRTALAAGGTKAILEDLCRRADLEKAWVHTEVKPRVENRANGIKNLLHRYGFETAPLGFETLCCRPPR